MTSRRRDRIIELTTLGVSGGGTGAVLALLRVYGFASEDVFALAGASIGAAATVAGALWVAERQTQQAHRRESSILIEACQPLRDEAQKVRLLYLGTGAWPREHRPRLYELWRMTIEIPALLREALDRGNTLDLRERLKVRKAEGAVLSFDRYYQDLFNSEDEPYALDERDWPSEFEQMIAALDELLEALRRD